MSKSEPIRIHIKDNIDVYPEFIYRATVFKSGNGAVIKSNKRFIGKKVIVIIEQNT